MTDIARHRPDRLRGMNPIYEAAEGSPMSHVSGGWLLAHLELSDEERGGICRYLEDERLMIRPMRTMARSSRDPRRCWPPPAAGSRCLLSGLYG